MVNEWGRCHDVRNLFIVDGSIFVTAAAVNPTNTIQALALYIADTMKKNLADALRLTEAPCSRRSSPTPARSPDMTTDSGRRDDFSPQAERTLNSVLDALIPASDDGRFPGAGELGLAAYIKDALQATPDLRAMILDGLADLDAAARNRDAAEFAILSKQDKQELLAQQGFILPLSLHAYAGYYQQPRVLDALGLEARAPHPQGYEMEPNDLSVLDPIRRRRPMYREVRS